MIAIFLLYRVLGISTFVTLNYPLQVLMWRQRQSEGVSIIQGDETRRVVQMM